MSKNAAGVEVFNGFKIAYPEYSVITPQTLKEFTIRSLTVEEEEKLKSSLLTPTKLSDHLNEIIFTCISKKPDDIVTYKDFLTKLTVVDRDALMYGLYHITYKDIHNYDISCAKCEHVNSVKVNFLNSFKATIWPDDKSTITELEIPIKFEIAKGITAIIRQPTLSDESELLKSLTFSSEEVRDMSMQLLIIKRFEIEKEGVKIPDTIEERENILKGYKQLPATDKDMIAEVYQENFGKYSVEIKSIVRCQKCGREDDVSIDLVKQFFRAMYK